MGIFAGTETQVNTYTNGDQYEQQITALASGGWVVTWQSDGQDGSGEGIYQQSYAAGGAPIGSEMRVNTHTASDQDKVQITELREGGWAIAWQSFDQDSSYLGVYQQVFDSDGTALGVETKVNTFTSDSQSSPMIAALADGGWVVVWMSYVQDGSAQGVYMQVYDSDLSPLGSETLVNTYTTDFQGFPQVAALTGGGHVVSWRSDGQDGSGQGVYQQAYNADHSPLGLETQVNTYTTSFQYDQKMAALPNGDWVVTWVSSGQDGSNSGIFQQAFDRDGNPLRDETRVNTFVSGHQNEHQVTALLDGGWVVSWQSSSGESNGYGIFQQAYDSEGAPIGAETQVNSHTIDD